ncbi:hypothetical protein [Paludisphaera mucosa]|uniref:Anti-sigma factor n=1 Tax=Paludisphaera mucosa TaxID=3030827 RepID=A0ABT6F6F3_9BACT|nr:hypothetical protein [Paludisphaera mucosa]MDG3003156.1 hypothetical protein [Paludisphaera mucosa]
MSQPEEADLKALERSLADLVPARSGLDRDRLMFEAGRRSVLGARRTSWIWPGLAASLALVAVGQAFVLSNRPAARVVIVADPRPAPPPTSEPVVILTRREPAATDSLDTWPQPLRTRGFRREEIDDEPNLRLLTAAHFGPLPEDTVETLKPLHGRNGDLRSIPGGPL